MHGQVFKHRSRVARHFDCGACLRLTYGIPELLRRFLNFGIFPALRRYLPTKKIPVYVRECLAIGEIVFRMNSPLTVTLNYPEDSESYRYLGL